MFIRAAVTWRFGSRCASALSALALITIVGSAGGQESHAIPLLTAMQQAVVDSIAAAEPSVVALARGRRGDAIDRLTDTTFLPYEYGTGVVIDRRGLILTNYHLLGEVKDSVYAVWLNHRLFYPATVKAADPWTDLAVLQIEAENLTPISFGDGSTLSKGQFVIALGNPYAIARDGSVSASWGIVSNLSRKATATSADRQIEPAQTLYQHGGLIQTDAHLKLGTSGGPLLNLQGQMVGLVTSSAALSGFDADASYAVPVDKAFLRVVERLKAGREAEVGFLGVQPDSLSTLERRDGRAGVRLGLIVQGTPAARDGLRYDDVITRIDNRTIHDPDDLYHAIGRSAPGDVLEITVERSDPILRRPRLLTRDVKLSKKRMETGRPIVVTDLPTDWRGARVDYVTTIADFPTVAPTIEGTACVAVVDVRPESPAWRAGLRAGTLITHVDGRSVSSPDEFYRAARSQLDTVQLRTISNQQRAELAVLSIGSEP